MCNAPGHLVKPDGSLQCFTSFLVDEEERLLGGLVVRLDGKCEGVVANEATVADEVTSVA